VQIKEST